MFDRVAPYLPELRLKVGTQVMLITNLDLDQGLINGSRGVVKEFSSRGYPVVLFKAVSTPIEVAPKDWVCESEGEAIFTRQQIPLRMAYAVTIHKAQGASLDSALVDVGKATFEYGQAYVALSRVRSLDALCIYDFLPKSFQVHPDVKAFYAGLKEAEA
jgi:ATP-dependent DNA helicase PIF1